MDEFLGYTIGLECNSDNKVAKLVKIEYSRTENGIRLSPVSGWTLGLAGGGYANTLSEEAFARRPRKTDVDEARWALNMCGWELMHDDYQKLNRHD